MFCISGGKVKAGDNAFYHDIIHIPPLPPSRLDGCNIIDVHYAIKVQVQVRPRGGDYFHTQFYTKYDTIRYYTVSQKRPTFGLL